MPNYDFDCKECDITIERHFSFHETPKVDCEKCGEPMKRVFNAPPAIFRGGGWGGS